MTNVIACQPLTDAQPVLEHWSAPFQPTSHSLHKGHGVLWSGIFLWSVWVSCLVCTSSSLLMHLLAGRAKDIEKSLTWGEHNGATTLSTLFSSWIQNTALDQLLGNKTPLSQLEPEQRTHSAHLPPCTINRAQSNQLRACAMQIRVDMNPHLSGLWWIWRNISGSPCPSLGSEEGEFVIKTMWIQHLPCHCSWSVCLDPPPCLF